MHRLRSSAVSPGPPAGAAPPAPVPFPGVGASDPGQHAPRRPAAAQPSGAYRVKRVLDVVAASVALVALTPAMVLIAFAVRAESRGPALFRQERIGAGGRRFAMWKFRTMVVDAEARGSALIALSTDPHWLHVDDDPRITRMGRVLRRTSLDELPQLLNVVRGEMSLVGPRPVIPAEHERMPAWAGARDDVRPGMTGLWQVAGRTSTTFMEMLWLDCVYVSTWSLRGDLTILVRTIPAVLSGRGAN